MPEMPPLRPATPDEIAETPCRQTGRHRLTLFRRSPCALWRRSRDAAKEAAARDLSLPDE